MHHYVPAAAQAVPLSHNSNGVGGAGMPLPPSAAAAAAHGSLIERAAINNATGGVPAAPPPPPVVQEVRRTGWIEKYSVGRGILPIRNWQRRWFTVDNHGLNYSKSQFEPPQKRTYVPFVTSTTSRDVFMNPVFLFPNVNKEIHSEATEPNIYYFALRFEENRTPRVLLLRTRVAEERDSWIRYLSQYVHAAALTTGVPAYHPLSQQGAKRGYDPDALDSKDQKALRQVVLDWDEGSHLRASGEPNLVPDPIAEAAQQSAAGSAGMSLQDAAIWGDDDDNEPMEVGGIAPTKAMGGAAAAANRSRGASFAGGRRAADDDLL